MKIRQACAVVALAPVLLTVAACGNAQDDPVSASAEFWKAFAEKKFEEACELVGTSSGLVRDDEGDLIDCVEELEEYYAYEDDMASYVERRMDATDLGELEPDVVKGDGQERAFVKIGKGDNKLETEMVKVDGEWFVMDFVRGFE